VKSGTLLGPFTLIESLGSGAMGSVWSARADRPADGVALGAQVALKILHPHVLERPGAFERFRREAELGRGIDHPNVVRTFGAGRVRSAGRAVQFLVMEYVRGQTLGALGRELGPLPEELLVHVAREVAGGLAAIHAAGAIHRDLKPENVIVTLDHQVKIMDLGLARLELDARLSRSGSDYGTPYHDLREAIRMRGT
jgi:serine/threonine-protein kinase